MSLFSVCFSTPRVPSQSMMWCLCCCMVHESGYIDGGHTPFSRSSRVSFIACCLCPFQGCCCTVFQSPQCIQHHSIIIQVFARYNFTPNRWNSDFVTNAWVERTQYWSAYNGFLYAVVFYSQTGTTRQQ